MSTFTRGSSLRQQTPLPRRSALRRWYSRAQSKNIHFPSVKYSNDLTRSEIRFGIWLAGSRVSPCQWPGCGPGGGRLRVPPSRVDHGLVVRVLSLSGFAHAVGVALGDHDAGVVEEPVTQGLLRC